MNIENDNKVLTLDINTNSDNFNFSLENNEQTLNYGIENVTEITDYNKLINLPKINDVELIGNKSSSELKLQGEMEALSNMDIENLLKGGI